MSKSAREVLRGFHAEGSSAQSGLVFSWHDVERLISCLAHSGFVIVERELLSEAVSEGTSWQAQAEQDYWFGINEDSALGRLDAMLKASQNQEA